MAGNTKTIVIFPNVEICEEPTELELKDVAVFSALDRKLERYRKRRMMHERAGRILRPHIPSSSSSSDSSISLALLFAFVVVFCGDSNTNYSYQKNN
ncbi:12396_t:CDS:2 [Ambispora leptoticha]|uniref:12396_t:CDS:1 n=1 Tax=Ambispora leptoticha TaxID=144679 RepID=A0A9N9FFC7_9GLOM|nr:12396_t:CDS:2 [Ambispora leptoticha]